MSRNPGVPHYRRIADALIARLGDRTSPLGRIPSERVLARQYGVARNTARRALDELRKLGYVSRVQGSGTHRQDVNGRHVFVFGYFTSTGMFLREFNWLSRLVQRHGIRLIVRDIGLYGEHLDEVFRVDEVLQAEAVIWGVSSHPRGIQAATAARRRLPRRQPMICLGQALGVPIQSRHRVDVVQADYPGAIRQILDRLDRLGLPVPVLVDRSDTTIAQWKEVGSVFLGELTQRGIRDAHRYVLPWDVERPRSLREFLSQAPKMPRPFILSHSYAPELRGALKEIGADPDSPMIEFDRSGAPFGIPISARAMAEATYDVLMSRMERPNRPNLHVYVSLPVRW
jgi:DNA-binding LacI/PurR family transcriptional regulator